MIRDKHKSGFIILLAGIVTALVLFLIALAASRDQKSPSDSPYSSVSSSSTTKSRNKNASVPARILDLRNWKLTLPVDLNHNGEADEIKQPSLSTFSDARFFAVTKDKKGVVFTAPVNGATTSHSSYPRSELREMNGHSSASWSTANGTHTMELREAITHLPVAKPEVVSAQIHNAKDDVIMIRLEKTRLFVEANGKNIGDLNKNYKLGQQFNLKISVKNNHIAVFYNGKQKLDYHNNGTGYYFKAGCYTQSNTSKGDKPGAYGQVVIYRLKVTHKY